jgi:flavodoxin
MKILVVFYSRSGHTKKVAENLAKGLKADIDEIVDLKDRSGIKGWLLAGGDGMKGALTEIKTSKNPKNYDLVIIGTPIWAWNSAPATRTYVTKFKKEIKNLALFSTAHIDGVKKAKVALEEVWGKEIKLAEGWITIDFENSKKYLEKINSFVERVRGIKTI